MSPFDIWLVSVCVMALLFLAGAAFGRACAWREGLSWFAEVTPKELEYAVRLHRRRGKRPAKPGEGKPPVRTKNAAPAARNSERMSQYDTSEREVMIEAMGHDPDAPPQTITNRHALVPDDELLHKLGSRAVRVVGRRPVAGPPARNGKSRTGNTVIPVREFEEDEDGHQYEE